MEANSLAAAHRGYQYQDLIAAISLVDVVLGRLLTPTVDRKLFQEDIFDDLTTVAVSGDRQRLQIKHTSGAAQPLAPNNFLTQRRGTRIDHLVAAIVGDSEAFPDTADRTVYRLLFTDVAPNDEYLRAVLEPAANPDGLTGLRLPTMTFQFNAEALLALRGTAVDRGPFAIALTRLRGMNIQTLKSVLARLVVETSSPGFSGDLSLPGAAEVLLLDRVRDEIGAGSFPNQGRSPIDIAAGLIIAAQSARTGKGTVDVSSLMRRLQIRTDYGAVLAATPVDPQIEVRRDALVDAIVSRVSDAATKGDRVVVTGPPGQGKSWASDQLATALSRDGWLVASHYCYLGEADSQRDDRVLLETIFGSLISRMAEADGSLVSGNLPRFAADKNALEQTLRKAIKRSPTGVAIIIDGLDHISRVISPGGRSDASLVVCEALAKIELPAGIALVVLSQPGAHLDPLSRNDPFLLSGMSATELSQLARRTISNSAVDVDQDLLDAIVSRSDGNALYATYLCREAERRDRANFPTAGDAVRALPDFDGSLRGYYEYLYTAVEPDTWLVAERLAIAPFGLTRGELKQLGSGHRVDAALTALEPVVRDNVGSGVRFYHESFGRYVREELASRPEAVASVLATLTSWLSELELFEDQRAFRWLIPLLAEQGLHQRVVDLIGTDFVLHSLMNAFAPRLVISNIAQGAESAARSGDWPAAARLIQLSNSAHMYAFERFELMVAFTDVQGCFVDPQTLADRMLDDGHLIMSGREGLLRSSAVDALGAVAPWRICIDAYGRERDRDNVHRGDDDLQQVGLAMLRGRMRLAMSDRSPDEFRWDRIAQMADSTGASVTAILDLIEDLVGIEYVTRLAEHSAFNAEFLLLLAERDPEYRQEAVAKLSAEGWPAGATHRVLAIGLDAALLYEDIDSLRRALLDSTRAVLAGPSSSREGSLDQWIDLCTLAARLDPVGLGEAEALTQGSGWYRDWLAFSMNLVRAEVLPESTQSVSALAALELLVKETNPFVGTPRACDLYSGHATISATVERALKLLRPIDWPPALRLLARASDATTTVGMGFSSGPLHADELARVVAKVSDARSRQSVRDFLVAQADEAPASVFYADIAAHKFRLARLEIEAGDSVQARLHWTTGVDLLNSYGSHKDSTIYEFLESLELLKQLDIPASRLALQRLQDVTLAIEHHTDGRGTSHVHSDWWKQVAVVDPEWLVSIALPELSENVNSTFWALQEAVEDLWTHWRGEASSTVAAAGRLAIESALLDTDAADLQRYIDDGLGETSEGKSMLRNLLARADERPTSTTYTNAKEILDQTEATAAGVNEVAVAHGLPRTFRVEPARTSRTEEDRWGTGAAPMWSAAPSAWWESGTYSPGLTGISEIIRDLADYSTTKREDRHELTSRYINALGYRLVELSAAGRDGEADQAIFAIADAIRFLQPIDLLARLSEGFAIAGIPELAATASVLTWTRSKSDGGWKSFGGPNNLDQLAKAFLSDENRARIALAKEVARAARSSDSIGPTQALIHAAARGALPWPHGPAAAAVECWNAAFNIVDARAPRFSEADRSEYPYVPSGAAGTSREEIDRFLAVVPLAKLALPGRESKRRALVALGSLLANSPNTAVDSATAFLRGCSDPITQLALLELVVAEALRSQTLLVLLGPTFRLLADSDLMSVRTLARSMIDESSLLPLGDPSPELRRALRTGLPDDAAFDSLTESVLAEFLGDRLDKMAEQVPEAPEVIRLRLTSDLNDGASGKRVNTQLEALTSRSTPRWPDAILAHEEAAEREIQTLAGSARAARILVGDPVIDSNSWEIELASRLETPSSMQLGLERNRWPRPRLTGAPSHEDPAWDQIQTGSDLRIVRDTFEPIALDGTSWICIGGIEERVHLAPSRDTAGQTSVSTFGIHLDSPVRGTLPLGQGSLSDWEGPATDSNFLDSHIPLVNKAVDVRMQVGLGGPRHVLLPSKWLRHELDLRETERMFTLADETGSDVLRLVTWRSEYESNDSYLSYPRVVGQAVVLRADHMTRLLSRFAARMNYPMLRLLRATQSPF